MWWLVLEDVVDDGERLGQLLHPLLHHGARVVVRRLQRPLQDDAVVQRQVHHKMRSRAYGKNCVEGCGFLSDSVFMGLRSDL